MPRPAGKHTQPRIAHTDPAVKVEVRKGHPCICPEAPGECSWMKCRSDCRACRRQTKEAS